MSIVSVLKQRKDLDPKVVLKAASVADHIEVGEDYFIFLIPKDGYNYLYVKNTEPRYSRSLFKKLINLIRNRTAPLMTDVYTSESMKHELDPEGVERTLLKLGAEKRDGAFYFD